MLTVTQAAAAAVTAILDIPEIPDGSGVRLETGLNAQGEKAIGIAIAQQPEPGDELMAGEEVFVDRELVELLDHHVLDAEIDGENVAFTIRPQSQDGQAT